MPCQKQPLDTITRIMAEQGHEGGQVHAGVHETGPEGVPELVKGDVQGLTGGAGETGVGDRGAQPSAEAVFAEPAAVFAEHEVGEVPVAGMGQRSVGASVSGPFVEQVDGFGVEGNHAFGAELAERDP